MLKPIVRALLKVLFRVHVKAIRLTFPGPGWHDSGDVVDIDDDGFIHILGRVKRFAEIAVE
jgi:acyl-coenzyme A synthetase/AMP-(fatty) acid ligase